MTTTTSGGRVKGGGRKQGQGDDTNRAEQTAMQADKGAMVMAEAEREREFNARDNSRTGYRYTYIHRHTRGGKGATTREYRDTHTQLVVGVVVGVVVDRVVVDKARGESKK